MADHRIESVSAEQFYAVVSKLKDKPFLRRRSLEEYQSIVEEGGYLFLLGENLAGYGVKSDGLLISVFNDSGIKGVGTILMKDATSNEKKKASALVCADGPLRKYYEGFGFVVTERFPMGPENAGYNLEWPNGIRPDMLKMTLKEAKP